MKRKLVIACGIALLCVAAAYLANVALFGKTQFERDFDKIQKGMTRVEVESILGMGTLIDQKSVPSIVVPINPADEVASLERARKAGTVPTARDYPVRLKPVVEGDVILTWNNKDVNETIYIAFKDGKVCATYFHDLNYL